MEDEIEIEDEVFDSKPLGPVIFVTGEGDDERDHYSAFLLNGETYELGDTVLCEPEHENMKPYVGIIKEIMKTLQGELLLTVQWFYRPEDAKTSRGGTWKPRLSRELFYSFHTDEIPAGSVMHGCVVHFIPSTKQVPEHKQHPGFVVQRVYDFEEKMLYSLSDRDYDDEKQAEIDDLVKKTRERLGNLPNLEPEGTAGNRRTKIQKKQQAEIDDLFKKTRERRGNLPNLELEVTAGNRKTKIQNKPLYRRTDKSPLDVSLMDGRVHKSRLGTPGSTTAIAIGSEYYPLLLSYKLLTNNTQRDTWLEKLLESIQSRSTPLASVSAVAALEKAVHNAFSSDLPKYKQKMRQLVFNLKSNGELARRLLDMELEPEQILKMAPFELKAALTLDEMKSNDPEELNHVQMTDAHCIRCSQEKVALADIFKGACRDRYKLECTACGKEWHADVGTVNIIEPRTTSNGVDTDSNEMDLGSPDGDGSSDPMDETS